MSPDPDERALGDKRIHETLEPLPKVTDDDVQSYRQNEVSVDSGSVDKSRFAECLSDSPRSYEVDGSFDVTDVVANLASATNFVPLSERRDLPPWERRSQLGVPSHDPASDQLKNARQTDAPGLGGGLKDTLKDIIFKSPPPSPPPPRPPPSPPPPSPPPPPWQQTYTKLYDVQMAIPTYAVKVRERVFH